MAQERGEPRRTAVADAAQAGDREALRALLKQGADVNASQGDGTTALHWAAMKGDAEMVQMLVTAGANLRATTRLGAYVPLYLAAKGGHSAAVASLLAAGADVEAASASGATPLMIAAAAGDTRTVTMLVEGGSKIDARDTAKGETALMYAAGYNRADVVRLLLQRGADARITTRVVDLAALSAPEEDTMARQAGGPPRRPVDVPGVTRPLRYNELIGTQGGLTAMHFAARQGFVESVTAMMDAGVDINQPNPGDHMTPLLIAIVNGHFDLAKVMVEQGREPVAAERQRRHAAVRGAERLLGAEVAVPRPEDLPAAAHRVSRVDEVAARQGRRRQRARASTRSGTRPTTRTSPAWTRAAPRRSGARRMPTMSTR